MTVKFDYVLTKVHDIDRLTAILAEPFDWTMQTTFGAGAIVKKSTSENGFVRIRIQTWDKNNRARLLALFTDAAADLAEGDIDTSLCYLESGFYVGWVFYHPKEKSI